MAQTDDRAFPLLARFRFRLEALEPIRLPPYAGSAWRGLLGRGLRRTTCVTRQPTCEGCLLIRSCVYSTLFETPPPQAVAPQGYTALPHPYVLDIDLDAPRDSAPGDRLELRIALIGPAILQMPYIIHALGSAGVWGIGTPRGRFRVCGLEREDTPGSGLWRTVFDADSGNYQQLETPDLKVPAAPDDVRVCLSTPLRIKRGGRFLGARHLELADLLRALYLRLRRLSELYGGRPEAFDATRLPSTPEELQIRDRQLRWHEWNRYSSRQGALMQMGGLLGELTLGGPVVAAAWPALWVGQWTHVGKGTAFGLGRYRLAPLEAPETSVAETDRVDRALAIEPDVHESGSIG